MSRVRSAIVTALVVIAIIVAAVFGVASMNIGATQRYNSFAANIPLGSEFTGYVTTTIYPEGVVSKSDYSALSEEDKSSYAAEGGVYVSLEESGYEDIASLKAAVSGDAEIIASRLGDRGLTDFSVTVRDGVTITVSLPSNYSYAEYVGDDSDGRAEALTYAASTLGYLVSDGELTLRTKDASITLTSGDEEDSTSSTYDTTRFADEYTDADVLGDGSKTYPFVSANEDATEYFTSVSAYTFGGSHVLSLNLSEYGRERIKYISTLAASSESQTIYVCVGDTQIISISCSSTIDSDVLQFGMNTRSASRDAAAVLNSVVNGGTLSAKYEDMQSALSSSATGGELAAIMAFVAFVVLLAAVCVVAAVKYKKLGGVLSMSFIILALVMFYALYILQITVTLELLIVCAGILVLFAVTNLIVLNEVRAQCRTGKTMQAAVKAAYKRTLLAVMDIHVVVLVAAILAAAVAVGVVANCGVILVIGTLASYILYWFTRLMWHVCSSAQRDKFAFGGFKREVYGDE